MKFQQSSEHTHRSEERKPPETFDKQQHKEKKSSIEGKVKFYIYTVKKACS
jgi:hypothetical protein